MLYKMHKLILKMEDLKMLAVKENKMELPKYLHSAIICGQIGCGKSNRKARNRNWNNQKANPTLKTKREINKYNK